MEGSAPLTGTDEPSCGSVLAITGPVYARTRHAQTTMSVPSGSSTPFADAWRPTPDEPAPALPPRRPKNLYLAITVIIVIASLILGFGLAGLIPGLHLGRGQGGSGGERSLTQYGITFIESGLPSGTLWSVTLNGSSQSSPGLPIHFTERNGSYSYQIAGVAGFTPSPALGTLDVAGANATVSVTFAPYVTVQSEVTFNETGLPGGTNWSVALGGTDLSSTGSSIQFSETNGSYSYTVGSVPGYVASPLSGNVTVNGAPQSLTIAFARLASATYTVVFNESGLPSGTMWSVTLISGVKTSITESITFNETNGTYTYIVGGATGYTPSPSSGNVSIHGQGVTTQIEYSSASKTPIGTAFALGNPVSSTCSTTEVTDEVCATAGDQIFILTIEQSAIALGDVLFEVKTSSGSTFTTSLAGSFTILDIAGQSDAYFAVPAGAGLNMTGAWTHYSNNASASTPITTTMTLVIDMGILGANWMPGQGDTVVAFGTGPYTGTTSPQTLP